MEIFPMLNDANVTKGKSMGAVLAAIWGLHSLCLRSSDTFNCYLNLFNYKYALKASRNIAVKSRCQNNLAPEQRCS